MNRFLVSFSVVLAAGVSLGASPAGQSGRADAGRETFNALAIASNNLSSGTDRVIIDVTRWSPEAERERIIGILHDKGQRALLDELRDNPPTGTIRTPDSLAYDLRYAQQTPRPDGGREILLITDRPMSFWEATRQPRSVDYPFTVVQMQMDGDGNGTGTITYATRIVSAGKYIVLEDFATSPVRLTEIRTEKRPD